MRIAALTVVLLSLPALARAQAPEPPELPPPTSLEKWLDIIEKNDYQLLAAVDQKGHYFAVKQDQNGDILFCSYLHSETPAESQRRGGGQPIRLLPYVTTITDATGKDACLGGLRQEKVETAEAKYKNGIATITMRYLAGRVYLLRNHDLPAVRVEYVEILPDGGRLVLFDQLIELKKRP